jgi:VPS28 protein
MTTTISLDEEVRLYSTNAEREKYSTLATLFGIIISLDYLERAYVRDSITAAECVFSIIFSIFVLSDCNYFEEIFASMHPIIIAVQDHVETFGN